MSRVVIEMIRWVAIGFGVVRQRLVELDMNNLENGAVCREVECCGIDSIVSSKEIDLTTGIELNIDKFVEEYKEDGLILRDKSESTTTGEYGGGEDSKWEILKYRIDLGEDENGNVLVLSLNGDLYWRFSSSGENVSVDEDNMELLVDGDYTIGKLRYDENDGHERNRIDYFEIKDKETDVSSRDVILNYINRAKMLNMELTASEKGEVSGVLSKIPKWVRYITNKNGTELATTLIESVNIVDGMSFIGNVKEVEVVDSKLVMLDMEFDDIDENSELVVRGNKRVYLGEVRKKYKYNKGSGAKGIIREAYNYEIDMVEFESNGEIKLNIEEGGIVSGFIELVKCKQVVIRNESLENIHEIMKWVTHYKGEIERQRIEVLITDTKLSTSELDKIKGYGTIVNYID